MIAEIAPTAPAYVDHMDLQDMEAALVAGTVDACAIAPASNTTGTPVYFLDQSVTMNDFQQGFTPQSFTFTMPYNATAWISFQQTAISVSILAIFFGPGKSAGIVIGLGALQVSLYLSSSRRRWPDRPRARICRAAKRSKPA